MIQFNNIEGVKEHGFLGFKTVKELNDNPNLIPNQMGVYLVLYLSEVERRFLNLGVGGFFKGKDSNISLSALKSHWVRDCKTIYIGRAGGFESEPTLGTRLISWSTITSGTVISLGVNFNFLHDIKHLLPHY